MLLIGPHIDDRFGELIGVPRALGVGQDHSSRWANHFSDGGTAEEIELWRLGTRRPSFH
jgi:hypothetical protein